MIEEDYVSFEVAKLLKEKGFECEKDSITAMYNEIGKFHPLSTAVDEYYYDYNDFDEYDYVAPTLQMTMKWLREVHNLHIFTIPRWEDVEYMPGEWEEQMTGYQYVIIDIGGTNRNINQSVANRAITPESSYEAAIKHCLENLI